MSAHETTFGINHLTVVPANFEPVTAEGRTQADSDDDADDTDDGR